MAKTVYLSWCRDEALQQVSSGVRSCSVCTSHTQKCAGLSRHNQFEFMSLHTVNFFGEKKRAWNRALFCSQRFKTGTVSAKNAHLGKAADTKQEKTQAMPRPKTPLPVQSVNGLKKPMTLKIHSYGYRHKHVCKIWNL